MGGAKKDVEKERYWKRTIREAARSKASIREFCGQRQLKVSQFYWWQRRLKEARPEPVRGMGKGPAAGESGHFRAGERGGGDRGRD